MTPDRFREITEMIHRQFTVTYEAVQPRTPPPGTVEMIEFESPRGLMRLEYITKPKVIDHKVIASRRIGAAAHEENVFDKNKNVTVFRVLQWNEADEAWVEMRDEAFGPL